MPQTRLTPGSLLDDQGRLSMTGWATSLVRTYDRRMIRAGALRIKEWDYYLIHDDHRAVALTIDDNSYMGLLGISWLNFDVPREHTVNRMSFLPLGKTSLPPTSERGIVRWEDKHGFAEFENDGTHRHLRARLDNFDGGKPLSADLTLADFPADSMVIATPFPDAPRAFYYNQKIIGMRASGTVHAGDEEYHFNPACSFGLLDWGRGVWTYDNVWFWCAAQGQTDGHVFGFNLGYGFGDTSDASENMLFFDGRAHKLEQVDFGIPRQGAAYDLMSPWHFTSSDGRFDAIFTPILDRANCTDFKLILSDQHQVFGHFSGRAVLDDGTEVVLRDFLGSAEVVHNKW
jgi:Protein of unknown function (DUF2804).